MTREQEIDQAVRRVFARLRNTNPGGRQFRSVADFLQRRGPETSKYVAKINGMHVRLIRAEFAESVGRKCIRAA